MRFLSRTTIALALALGALTPVQVAGAAGGPGDNPRALLAQRSHGQAALNALGNRVAEAAAVNGMTAREFRSTLSEDPRLWVGRDGRMFAVEDAPATAGGSVEGATEIQPAAALEDTFSLHSLPGSNHTIYLDFGGIVLPSTSWWVTDGGMPARTYGGYSQDGDPAFNDTEKAFVQQVWSMMAEKYSPFDVDVTTEDPGPGALNRTSAGDATFGTRVVITSDDNATADACGGCPGVALIDVFDTVDNGQYEPAWVLTDILGTAILTANAAAHEVGHTFGLLHDGTSGSSYYSGHNQWVPIMGTTTSRPVTQFSKGEYSGASNTEDDLAIIASSGAPLLADDYPDTTGTAATLSPATSYTVTGKIRNAADKDVFAVSRSCVNDLTATATGVGAGQTLDLKVSVYNAAGALIGANDPASANSGGTATGMNAAYTVTSAAAATYYVEVDGVGSGGLGNTPNPSTGYSDYASIGQYTLTITGCPVVEDPPSAPQNLSATPTLRSTSGSVTWSAPASSGGGAITGYTVTGLPGGAVNLSAGTTAASSTSLVPGTTYNLSVVARNAYGDSPAATTTLKVPTWVPSAAPVITPSVTGKDASATWTVPANPGGATITGWATVLKKSGVTVASSTEAASPRSIAYTSLAPGSYTLSVTVVATAEDTSGTTAGTTSFSIAGDAPSAPQSFTATPTPRSTSGLLTWDPPATAGDGAVSGYSVTGLPGGTRTTSGTSLAATGLNPGTTYNLGVRATNSFGSSTSATTSLRIDTWAPTSAPAVSTSVVGSKVTISWTTPPNPGNSTPTGYAVVLTRPSGSKTAPRIVAAGSNSTLWSGVPSGDWGVSVTPLATADDVAGITAGTGGFTVAGRPDAPRIGKPSFGTKGGAITAVARWAAPADDGGAPITGYRVIAYKLTASEAIAKAYFSPLRSTSSRHYKWTTLPAGKYRFRVVAYNSFGVSPKSAFSSKVLAR